MATVIKIQRGIMSLSLYAQLYIQMLCEEMFV